jgi:uncharacterized protein
VAARPGDRTGQLAAGRSPAGIELRCLDAIHLATAQQLGVDLARIVTYDDRMAAAADHLGLTVARPS